MTAPTLGDRPELTCWLCGNLGAVRRIDDALGPVPGGIVWLPFRFDPAEGIRLDRGEHTCPACHGSHNPHRTEFPIQLGGGAS